MAEGETGELTARERYERERERLLPVIEAAEERRSKRDSALRQLVAQALPNALGSIVGGIVLAGLAGAIGLLDDLSSKVWISALAIGAGALLGLVSASRALVPAAAEYLYLSQLETEAALEEFRAPRGRA